MAELRLNRFGERIMVAGSGCALVGAMAAVDGSVAGSLGGLLKGNALNEATMASARVQRIVGTITETVGYQGAEHTTLALFALTAIVLLVLMLRT